MVKKGSKAGLHTGNTIRRPGGRVFLKRCQKYSYFITNSSSLDGNQKRELADLTKYLPSDDGYVEYSMNKKKRWELPKILHAKLINESDNPKLHMVVTEHIQKPLEVEDEHEKFCSAYYTNNGPVLCKKSHTEMNMKSAMQYNIMSDHLTKKERRQLRKSMAQQDLQGSGEQEESVTPHYSCHIIHSAESNGKLYKDLYKGVAWHKKFHSGGYSKLDHKAKVTGEDIHFRFEALEEELDDVLNRETTQTTAMVVPITDLIKPTKKSKRKACQYEDYVLV